MISGGNIKDGNNTLIARGNELSRLRKFLSRSRESNNIKLLLFSGERGIGKTYFLKNIRPEIEKEDFLYLRGKCYHTSSDPYLPLKEAFNQYENKMESSELKETVFISPHVLPESVDQDHEDTEIFADNKETILYETMKGIKNMVKKKPIFISLDDLHWSDHQTLNMIHYLSIKLRNYDILFAGTYDDNEIQNRGALANFLFNMKQEGLVDVSEMEPMNKEETKMIIENLIPIEDPPEKFVTFIYMKSKGNPLFIKEIVCHLKTQERSSINSFSYKKAKEYYLPPTLSSIIEHRYENLSERSKHIMDVGAVIGEKIDFDILATVIEIKESELLDEIDILLEKKLWGEDEKGMLRFTHPLFRMVVYRSISSLKKKKLHKKIAEAIESIKDDTLYLYHLDVAHHYERAEIHSSAFLNYERAGIDAEKVGEHVLALDCYDKALKLDGGWDGGKKEKKRVSIIRDDIKKMIEQKNIPEKYIKS